MGQVDHHAHAIHFAHDLTAESTQSVVLTRPLGRVADIIVAVMAKSHIHDTHLPVMPDAGDVAPDAYPFSMPMKTAFSPARLAAITSSGVRT